MKITEVRAVYPNYRYVVPSWRTHFWQVVVRYQSCRLLVLAVVLMGCSNDWDVETSDQAGVAILDSSRSSSASGLMRLGVICGGIASSEPTVMISWDGNARMRFFANATVSWDGSHDINQVWLVVHPPTRQQYDSNYNGGGVLQPSKPDQDAFLKELERSRNLRIVLDSPEGGMIEAEFRTTGAKRAINRLVRSCR